MPAVRLPKRERRRDPRFALTGSVRLVVRQPLLTVEGTLTDVSAGGLRCAFEAAGAPPEGQTVEVDVTIRETGGGRPPTIHLRGQGAVVRRTTDGASATEVAVHLTGPLGFRDYFSQVRVF